MKIDFEKVYFDEANKYLLFKSKPEKYYLLRVMDFNNGARFGDTIANPEVIKKGCCVIGEYLLTKEEFDLWDTDEAAFEALVESLAGNGPSDRLLKLFFQSTPQSQPMPLKANLGEPTGVKPSLVEEMKASFQEESNAGIKKFKKFLEGNGEEMYFVHSNHINKIFPAIDFEGKIFFIESEAEAKKFVKATEMFGNKYYKVNAQQANEIIKNCKRYGVYKIIFCLANGGACIFDRDVLLGAPTEDKWQTYNSSIYNIFIRCIECAGIDNAQVKANQMTFTSQLSHQIFNAAFLLPLNVKAEEKPNTIVLSRGAEKLYKEKSFVHCGAEDCTYEPMEGNEFSAITLTNSEDKSRALPLFTDYEEFNLMFKDKVVPIAVTIEEAYAMLNDSCKIIIFNPSTLGFIFTEQAMNQLKELSKKPVTVFRPSEEKPAEEKPVEITIPEVPRQVSTENILHMVANQITHDEAVKRENAPTAETKPKLGLAEEDESELTAEKEEALEEAKAEEADALEDEEVSSKADGAEEKAESVEASQHNDDNKKGGFFSRFRKKK